MALPPATPAQRHSGLRQWPNVTLKRLSPAQQELLDSLRERQKRFPENVTRPRQASPRMGLGERLRKFFGLERRAHGFPPAARTAKPPAGVEPKLREWPNAPLSELSGEQREMLGQLRERQLRFPTKIVEAKPVAAASAMPPKRTKTWFSALFTNRSRPTVRASPDWVRIVKTTPSERTLQETGEAFDRKVRSKPVYGV